MNRTNVLTTTAVATTVSIAAAFLAWKLWQAKQTTKNKHESINSISTTEIAPITTTSFVDPTTDPKWQQYVADCTAVGVRDLVGIDFSQVAPYISLNQYQRDQLTRTIPCAPYRLYRSGIELIEKNLCVTCWLLKNCCMCPSLKAFQCRHKIFILMHHKEFGRGSNTGKLAVRAAAASTNPSTASTTDFAMDPASITSTSALIQTEIPIQERALLDLCEREPLNTVVLFPSDESITIEEFAQQRGWSLPTNTSTAQPPVSSSSSADPSMSPVSSLPPCPPLNIILLDGTWRQARSMKYLLPKHIPAIRIDPFKYPLDGTLRPPFEVAVPVPSPDEMKEAEELQSPLDDENKLHAPDSDTVDRAPSASTSTTSTRPSKRKQPLSQRDPTHLNGKVPPPTDQSKTFVSLFYPLRKQSQPDRISTIEALVILLKDLHESDDVTHRLLDLLRILVDSMRVQSGMNSVYGTFTKEEAKRMRAEVCEGKSGPVVASYQLPSPSTATVSDASSSPPTSSASLPSDGFIVGPKGGVFRVSSSSTGVQAHRVTRKERAQRATAMRPCLQWNRGASSACRKDPCRYSHICVLCNGDHRACDCRLNDGTHELFKQAAKQSPTGELIPIRG